MLDFIRGILLRITPKPPVKETSKVKCRKTTKELIQLYKEWSGG